MHFSLATAHPSLLSPITQTMIEFSSYRLGSFKVLALKQEVRKMLEKGCWKSSPTSDNVSTSCLFFMKATESWRPDINLSLLIAYSHLMRFKIEIAASVLFSIKKIDFMASLVLKNKSFQILIHQESRMYLCFVFERVVYQLELMCFGLPPALLAFM